MTEKTSEQQNALADVQARNEEILQLNLKLDLAKTGLTHAVQYALRSGVNSQEIATVLGVSRSRVYQIRDLFRDAG